MATSAYQTVLRLVDQLTGDERLQLIAYLALAQRTADVPNDKRPAWSDIAGSVRYPALGEDAQTWVTRTRQESDDERRAQMQEGQ
jgi:hypothetical protein